MLQHIVVATTVATAAVCVTYVGRTKCRTLAACFRVFSCSRGNTPSDRSGRGVSAGVR